VQQSTPSAVYGEAVSLDCITSTEDGNQNPEVEWEFVKNGSDVPRIICSHTVVMLAKNHGKYDCKSKANRNTLVIHRLQFNDSGEYICVEDRGRGPGQDLVKLHVSSECCFFSRSW